MTRWLALLLACCAGGVQAQSVSWRGYLDLRVALPADAPGWTEGGLGKTRFGGGDVVATPAGALAGAFQLTPELLASAELQWQPDQRRDLDVLDAWVRYRPVSTTAWRWSVRAGLFYPPVSLENDNVGWTSRWSLTPSAINSWVGEELRGTGVEFELEHRALAATWRASVAAFGRNDPAGDLLASRGWALGDLTTGAGGELREPDAYAPVARAPLPVLFRPFREIDHRIGWHASLERESAGGDLLSLARYDNRGDPQAWERFAGRRVFAWHTRFWSLGGRVHLGDLVLLAQAMDGGTAFEPQPGRYMDTRLSAGYALLGWTRGDWEPALRIDRFRLRQLPGTLAAPLGEHGSALTAALNWRPREGWRISGELLRVDSTRDQRRLEGLAPRQIELQTQLSVRYYF
jgi:hypothetical protein